MALMMGKLHDALRSAHVPEDMARAAAEEAAEFHTAISEIKSMLRLHTWILSVNSAVLIAIGGKLFIH